MNIMLDLLGIKDNNISFLKWHKQSVLGSAVLLGAECSHYEVSAMLTTCSAKTITFPMCRKHLAKMANRVWKYIKP